MNASHLVVKGHLGDNARSARGRVVLLSRCALTLKFFPPVKLWNGYVDLKIPQKDSADEFTFGCQFEKKKYVSFFFFVPVSAASCSISASDIKRQIHLCFRGAPSPLSHLQMAD